MRLVILAAAPLAAFIASPVLADKAPAETATEAPAQTEQEPSEKTEKAEPKAKEAKRICRRIRADASSRRKTRICMTAAEWREVNQGS